MAGNFGYFWLQLFLSGENVGDKCKKHRGPGPVSWTTKFKCQQI